MSQPTVASPQASRPTSRRLTFRPIAYRLDLKAYNAPLTRHETPHGDGHPTTIGGALSSLGSTPITECEEGLFDVVVKTDSSELTFGGPSCCRRLFAVLLDFQRQGIPGPSCEWYWYDRATNFENGDEAYSFFVTHERRIVNDSLTLFTDKDGSFDPSFFAAIEDPDSPWSDQDDWQEARHRWWYQKFYREAVAGQLMLLRPDTPTLYHYPQGRLPLELAVQGLRTQVAQLQTTATVAVVLLLILGIFTIWK